MIMHKRVWNSITGVFLGVLFCGTGYAAVYPMPAPGNSVVGEVVTVKSGPEDTLLTIGNRYGVGMHEMLEANPNLGLDENSASRFMGAGRNVVVPTQYVLPPFRKGIVINLPELRLYYFSADGHYVYTYPVGLGRMEWRTPLVKSSVVQKQVDPEWRVPKSIHQYVLEETGRDLPAVVPPGPDNPLGKYAMRLSMGNYLIHGTNQPWSIGKFVSSGCIRLHNEDVEQLFQMVTVGTPVYIINYANKAGWQNGRLYLESQHPMHINAPNGSLNPASPKQVIVDAAKSKSDSIDWGRVNKVLGQATGLPEPVSGPQQHVLTMQSYDAWDEY